LLALRLVAHANAAETKAIITIANRAAWRAEHMSISLAATAGVRYD
jgi:hypothetical protein